MGMEALQKVCAVFGEVVSVRLLPKDDASSMAALVRFRTDAEATNAVDTWPLLNPQIVAKFANPQGTGEKVGIYGKLKRKSRYEPY